MLIGISPSKNPGIRTVKQVFCGCCFNVMNIVFYCNFVGTMGMEIKHGQWHCSWHELSAHGRTVAGDPCRSQDEERPGF